MSPHSIAKNENRQIAEGIFEVWKYRSETLAALLSRCKKEECLSDSTPVTYAGRLDPMADGKVILLVGPACREKENFSMLQKTYEFTILFGVATDTFDVLGLITEEKIQANKKISDEQIEVALIKIKNTPLPYPPYSSKPVEGKPLFVHARENTLPNKLPLQPGKILILEKIKSATTLLSVLTETIIIDIQNVEGDFRQTQIIEEWGNLSKKYGDVSLTLITFTATVTSGTYIRSIAHKMGELLGIPAIAYSITRTKVG